MRKMIVCVTCGETGKHAARGLCNKCYKQLPEQLNKGRKQALAWYYAHADEANKRQQVYRSTPDGRAKRNATLRKHYVIFRDRIISKVIEWDKAHAESRNIRINRHRLRKIGTEGTHTITEWVNRKLEYNNRCAYCHTNCDKLTKDHMTPVSWVGLSSDAIDNIVPACRSCNSSKCNKNILMFLLAKNLGK